MMMKMTKLLKFAFSDKNEIGKHFFMNLHDSCGRNVSKISDLILINLSKESYLVRILFPL